MERISAGNEMAFRLGFSGHSGHLRLEPLAPVQRHNPLLDSIPDFVIPPAYEPETPDTLKKYLEEKYLTPQLDPDEFSVGNSGRQWDFDWFDRAKMNLEPSAPTSVIVPSWELPFRRKQNHGSLGIWDPDAVEMEVSKLMEGAPGFDSLARMPGPSKDFVRGSTSNRPFRPGGLDGSQSSERVIPVEALSGQWVQEIMSGGLAQTMPPGYKKGLDIGPLKRFPLQWNCVKEAQSYQSPSLTSNNMAQLSLQFDEFFSEAQEESIEGQCDDRLTTDDQETGLDESTDDIGEEDSAIDEMLVSELGLADGIQKHDSQKKENEILLDERVKDIASNFHELVPDLAVHFPFDLDKFQKEAIYYIEKGESVFVAAHTSAGKTVVAEYAFALTSKHCTRAVYTAPIKTISNQKYRDFCEKFDVGLLTGDVSLRPEASCLIMTTEILRSMLYRGADIIRDIEWVIFDEVHYVNDVERGVVWEEIIIMLPRHVNIILLSATVPNTKDFADWIERTKQKKIRVTGTSKRPVPLEHCLFYSGELYKICHSENFLPQGLAAAKEAQKMKNSLQHGSSSAGRVVVPPSVPAGFVKPKEKLGRGRGGKHNASAAVVGPNNRVSWRSESALWMLLINRLANKSLLPVVIFCFSKNRCDKSADNITGMDLTSSSEKNAIGLFCKKAFTRLKGSDRNLPQVVRVENLLRRGIGVHHAGLLPIVKEVVEMLFCRGLTKVLFSTETFAMGVNAPARTVVFDTLRKFDGKEFRSLLPGEYIQMAGRAGRRGLDKIGTVIVMCREEIPEERELKHVMIGTPTRLESQFRLTYTMILHLLRLEELKVEDMLKRSFAEFPSQQKLPEKQQLLLLKLAQPTKAIECIKGDPAIADYVDMSSRADKLGQHISEVIMQSPAAQHFLSPGRVIIVRSLLGEEHFLGVVIKTPSATYRQFIVLLLVHDDETLKEVSSSNYSKAQEKDSSLAGGYFIPPKGKRDLEEYVSSSGARKGSGVVNIKLPYSGYAAGNKYEVVGIENKDILSICECKIKIDQFGLLEEPSNAVYSRTVQELLGKKPQGNKYPAALDPLKDLKVTNVELVEEYHRHVRLLQRMTENKCNGCVKLKEHQLLIKEINKHKEEVNALRFQMSDQALQQMPDFRGRIDVLKKIGCIDSDLVVQIKGRVACEMNSGEELICTECLFENQLEQLEPEEAVALMSALVFQQKNTSEPKLSFKLANAKKRLHDTAIRLGELQAHFNLAVNPEDYVNDNLKFGLVEVVYEWAKGTAFAEICELTDVPEGLIVRTIVRLDETCREFRNAASIMGNSALYKKMEIASNAIKRDIVFAASLYVTGV